MSGRAPAHVVVLGSSFAGLSAARFIHAEAGSGVRLTVIDKNPYLTFVPNIPMEVCADRDPLVSMHMETVRFHDHDGSEFIGAEVTGIDPGARTVTFTPSDRAGSAPERIGYDFLVVALGSRLAYDRIEGFGEHGDTVSSGYYGNKAAPQAGGLPRRPGGDRLGGLPPGAGGQAGLASRHRGGLRGAGPGDGAVDGALAQGKRHGDARKITMFTPAKVIAEDAAEDAGEAVVKELLALAAEMGFGYLPATRDVTRITAHGIEFASRDSLEAEIKIVLPDWVPPSFLRDLPISDERGFVITGRDMRSPLHPEIFAVGDAAALTVPKLGSLGDMQARIVARRIAIEAGHLDESKAGEPYRPVVACFGDMGARTGFYIHSDTWYGGKTSVLKMGYTSWAMKMAFKGMYFSTGGKPASWGMPAAELIMDHLPHRAGRGPHPGTG